MVVNCHANIYGLLVRQSIPFMISQNHYITVISVVIFYTNISDSCISDVYENV